MAFSAITGGLDWQDVDFINELVGAYSERRQAIGASSVSDISAGHDIQAASFWAGMQDWIEDNCTSFVNHEEPIEGETAVPMYADFAAFCEVADLHEDGWRRATSWAPPTAPTYSHGQMQAGDIIGPWIFEDLQKALDALRWTKRIPVTWRWRYCYENYDGAYGWSAWTEATYSVFYKIVATHYYPPGDDPFDEWRRDHAEGRWTDCPALTATVVAYGIPKQVSPYTFYDCDNLGFGSYQDKLCACWTDTTDGASTQYMLMANFTTAPSSMGDEVPWGCYISTIYGVFKWDFTHTL